MSAAEKISFEIVSQPEYLEIKFLGTPEADDASAFNEQVKETLEKSPNHVIVRCESQLLLPTPWLRSLLILQQGLKAADKQFRIVNNNEAFLRFLVQQGVNTSLRASASVRAAMLEMGLIKEKSFDVKFINPFLTATIGVLKTQASTQAKPGQIYKKDARDRFMGDISGVIGLVSEAFSGSVVISFPEPTFLKIISRMLGEEYTEITKEIEDGAGELTNIIFGQAKVTLNELGYGIKTALPSVVAGHDHSITQMTNGPRVVIPFESDAGPFFVEVCTSKS
jgi:chemotaxis protein CheX